MFSLFLHGQSVRYHGGGPDVCISDTFGGRRDAVPDVTGGSRLRSGCLPHDLQQRVLGGGCSPGELHARHARSSRRAWSRTRAFRRRSLPFTISGCCCSEVKSKSCWSFVILAFLWMTNASIAIQKTIHEISAREKVNIRFWRLQCACVASFLVHYHRHTIKSKILLRALTLTETR